MKRTCNFVIGSLVWDTQWRGWEHQLLSTSATFCHYIWFAIYKYIFSVYVVAFPMGWKLDAFTHADVLFVFLWTCFVSKSTHLMIQVVWYITDVILLTFVRIISWISRIDDYRGPTKRTLFEKGSDGQKIRGSSGSEFVLMLNLHAFFCVDLGLGQLVFKNYTHQMYIYIYYIGYLVSSTVGTWDMIQIEVTLYF